MRSSFSAQLQKVWGKPPFSILKKWEDSQFAAGAPRFTRVVGGQTFVPLYGNDVGVGVSLDITLLTGLPIRKPVISAGDLDNRIKRIIDALRVPQGHGEMQPNLQADGRYYSLIENDDAVLSLTAQLGPYLGSNDPAVSFAVIRVRPIAMRVNTGNLEMLF